MVEWKQHNEMVWRLTICPVPEKQITPSRSLKSLNKNSRRCTFVFSIFTELAILVFIIWKITILTVAGTIYRYFTANERCSWNNLYKWSFIKNIKENTINTEYFLHSTAYRREVRMISPKAPRMNCSYGEPLPLKKIMLGFHIEKHGLVLFSILRVRGVCILWAMLTVHLVFN